MANLRELLDIFLGRTPVQVFASHRISISTGAVTYALSFLAVAVLIVVEALVLRAGYWLWAKEPLIPFLLGEGVIVLAAVIAVPLLLVAKLAAAYVWGAIHYSIARFFSNKPLHLNDFNGSLITLFSAFTFAKGIVALIPIIGWAVAALLNLYELLMLFRFVKEKFNLTDAQATIVVLVPFNILLGALLLFMLAASFLLLGNKFF